MRGAFAVAMLLSLSAADAPPAAGPAWIEAIPLTRFADPAQVFVLEGPEQRAVLAGGGEQWLVCSGGAVLACRKAHLPDGADLPVARAPGVPVRARLASGREPVAGARLSVTPLGVDARRSVRMPLKLRDGELVREVVSGADGTVSLPPLAVGSYWLEVRAPWGRGYEREVEIPEPERLRGQAGPGVDLGDWELDPGGSLAFFLADDRGLPVAGALLRMTQGRSGDAEPLAGFLAAADAEGFGQVGGVAPHRPVRIDCFGPDHLPGRVDFEVPPPFAECSLTRAAGLAGKVVDAEGRPLAGAVVAAADARAVPGSDGHFELSGLPPGQHRLTVAAPGQAARELAVELAAGELRDLGELALAPGDEVRGEVVDATSGEPVAGAHLAAVEPPGAVAATTGADGTFAFQAGTEGGLALELTAAGYPATRVVLEAAELASGEPLRLALGRAGFLRAAVWNEETGEPCAGCSVSLDGPSEAGFLTTGPAGDAVSPPLAPGRYQVYLEEVGNHGSSITVHVGRNTRKVEVRPGEMANVRFGEPRPRLAVRLSRGLPAGWSVTAEGPRGRRVYAADDSGIFELLRGAGEALHLRLSGPGVTVPLADVAADFNRRRLDVEVPDTAVTGHLPAAGQVRLVPLAPGREAGAWARTGADGSFRVPFLVPGPWAAVVDGRVVARFSVAAGAVVDLGALAGPPEG